MTAGVKISLVAVFLIGTACCVLVAARARQYLRDLAREILPAGPCRVCEEIRGRDDHRRWDDPFVVDPSLASLVCRQGPGQGGWGSWTPLRTAAWRVDYNALLAILDSGADPNLQIFDVEIGAYTDRTPLMELTGSEDSASRERAEKCAQLLLDRGASLDARDRSGKTALHDAWCSIVLSKLLVSRGADLDLTDDHGETPLHLAAKNIHKGRAVEVVSLLIEAGADLTIKNVRGQTALELCNTPEKRAAFQKAMEQRRGLPPRGRLVSQGTALHAALAAGNQVLFRELLANGGDPNELNAAGDAVVHLAAEMEDGFWLDESLKSGGKANALNIGNRTAPDSTPLYYAIRALRAENVLRLIGAGADVNHNDHYGTTPFFAAILRARYDIAVVLVRAGANPRHPMPSGATALNYWDFFNDRRGQLINDPQRRSDYLELENLLKAKGYLTPQDLERPY